MQMPLRNDFVERKLVSLKNKIITNKVTANENAIEHAKEQIYIL